jgi:hypothetical protein
MNAPAGFRGSRLALAIALPLPVAAWYGAQQGLGVLVRLRCASAVGPGVAAGVLALLGCALAIWLSRGSRRGGESPPAQNDAVLRMLVLLGAAVFGLAIVFQTVAVLIVPSCAR